MILRFLSCQKRQNNPKVAQLKLKNSWLRKIFEKLLLVLLMLKSYRFLPGLGIF